MISATIYLLAGLYLAFVGTAFVVSALHSNWLLMIGETAGILAVANAAACYYHRDSPNREAILDEFE